jgi:putative N6-adenine-specific DNA methylase
VKRVETQVIVTPGLETITAGELTRLGVRVARTGRGGLSCEMTFPQLVLAHLQLRTATRILVRLRRFRAERFDHVTAGVAAIPWSEWLAEGQAVAVRASASGSRLYHTGAITDAAIEGLPDGCEILDETSAIAAADAGAAIVSIRVSHDTAVISIDASGQPLYRRGWRTHVGEAPLRETAAAAMVLWSGWTGRTPLLDPCCGAGTVAIEAAQWARRIAPGANRSFALERWPSADAAAVQRIRDGAAADVMPRVRTTIVARDVDTAILDAARANAQRAGVADDIVFEQGDVRRHDGPPWFVITNPPYGVRLTADTPAVQAGLARASSTLTVIAPAKASRAWIGRPVIEELPFSNGGLDVALVRA